MTRQKLKLAVMVAVLATILAACGGEGFDPGPGPDPNKATMSGQIHLPGSITPDSLGEVLEAELLDMAPVAPLQISARDVRASQSREFDPEMAANLNLERPVGPATSGEIIVTFEPNVLFSQAQLGTLSAGNVTLQHVMATASGRHLYDAGTLDADEALELASELRSQPEIRNAVPNWIVHSFAAPNDEFYPGQWHYDAISMEAAWEVSTGSDSVTVAVVDTGSIEHPDLDFTGGYDFISDPNSAGDGDGRDDDPTDLGDGTNYHGAHVAGTIGARTNNFTGVAGVSWDVTIVPIRVLGRNGEGVSLDILDAIEWAAFGLPGLGNPNPAEVINVSLGTRSGVACSLVDDRNLFNRLAENDITVVAAAGNDGQNTAGVFPANCPGVITVGATGLDNERPAYSNFGDEVDVMAPGGDPNATYEFMGTSQPYAVLSTILDRNGDPNYGYQIGTSMAAPHVAGIAALLLAQNPGMSSSEVLQTLRSTTSEPVCDDGCGAGLVNAAAALGAVDVTPPTPPPAGGSTVYLVLSRCETTDCNNAHTHGHARFDNVSDLSFPYILRGLEPGYYLVDAWQDLNGTTDLEATPPVWGIDPHEPFGWYEGVVILEAGQETTGIDLRLRSGTQ